jgi:hypothetical protein
MNFCITVTRNMKISSYMFVVNAFRCSQLVVCLCPVNEMNEAWELIHGGCLKFPTVHDSKLLQNQGFISVLAQSMPQFTSELIRTVNKCLIGTGYLNVLLHGSLYFTMFQLLQTFLTLFCYMFQYGCTVISCACQVYLLHFLFILLVNPTD